MKKTLLLLVLTIALNAKAQDTDNLFTIVTKYSSEFGGSTRMGNVNPAVGFVNNVGTATSPNLFSVTGGSVNQTTNRFNLVSTNFFMSFDLFDGSIQDNLPINSFFEGTTLFSNVRYNNSNNTLYGLASTFTENNELIGMYLASLNTETGDLTALSQNSVGNGYQLAGTAVNPLEMVYYYSSQGKIIGLDLYNGQVYSNQTITFPQGGLYFDNYTYNCADTTIYGIIRTTTTIPNVCYLGKINPQTGVATRVSQQPLPYNSYTINGSSTVDPINGVYYCSALLPQGGYAVAGISVTTGLVVFEQLITPQGAASNSLYFDLLRHPSDCYQAEPERLNPNSGSAGLNNVNKSKLKVTPNPFDQQLNIVSNSPIQTFIIRDAQGKIHQQLNPAALELQVETASLANGIYFLELHTANGTEIVKVVK